MTKTIFDFQIQAIQKMTQLHKVMGDKPMQAPQSLYSFQQSMMQTGLKFWQNIMSNPEHMMDAQARYLEFMQSPVTNDNYNRYFKSEQWTTNPFYQWLKDSYIKTAEWTIQTIEEEALGFTEDEKNKLLFLTRQMIEGTNPRNFPLTNPDVMDETFKTNGQNLLKGLDNLIKDVERGAISMTDENAFQVGKNIATTKGDVIYKNDMIELIHYHPTTEKIHAEPIVIIPPWINKYYILDLTPENSMIKWLVNQGHSVFCISWKNPDANDAALEFKDYMHDGALQAIEIAAKTHDGQKVNAVGYCIGGTLLAMTQAWAKAKKKALPLNTTTFFTTLLDFDKAGDLKVFADKDQIETLNQSLMENGIMDGKSMSMSFSLLRASDLIWSFVINNYFMGRDPVPFDLLYWNSDSTNLPAAMHCDYLQSMYLDNALAKGTYVLDGVKVDLSKITAPAYILCTADDHIAPAKACQDSANLIGSPDKTIVIGGSGHIAGVINPPHKGKYGYEIDNKNYDGSWWGHWDQWLKNHNKNKMIGTIKQKQKPINPAPGDYILKKYKK